MSIRHLWSTIFWPFSYGYILVAKFSAYEPDGPTFKTYFAVLVALVRLSNTRLRQWLWLSW